AGITQCVGITMKMPTYGGMDAVGRNQHVRTATVAFAVATIDKVRRDAVIFEIQRFEGSAGVQALGAEPFDDSVGQEHLQCAAVYGELGHRVAGSQTSRFLPDFLAVEVVVVESRCLYGHFSK